ncbi:4'-phosphopantetheinyl transferase [Nonomuraea sp. NPDC059023]|uniref:4'-phosphopantetheinyl transferase family protein n=1 Tax=unclassified Nonomuraea TaxID=2593643 RepID=UPI00368829DF
MIEDILPPEVEAFETFDDPPGTVLFPEEEALIGRAVEKRRREFATARYCVRRAMGKLGMAPVAVLRGPRGEPTWPPGIAGSITHCTGYRAAALTRKPAMLGIDAEPDAPVGDDVIEAVSLPHERDMLRRLAATSPGPCWDRLLFSAKESVYKAWFPMTNRWLGFYDAEIDVDPFGGTFSAHIMAEGLRWQGRWLIRNGLIVTAIARIGMT